MVQCARETLTALLKFYVDIFWSIERPFCLEIGLELLIYLTLPMTDTFNYERFTCELLSLIFELSETWSSFYPDYDL